MGTFNIKKIIILLFSIIYFTSMCYANNKFANKVVSLKVKFQAFSSYAITVSTITYNRINEKFELFAEVNYNDILPQTINASVIDHFMDIIYGSCTSSYGINITRKDYVNFLHKLKKSPDVIELALDDIPIYLYEGVPKKEFLNIDANELLSISSDELKLMINKDNSIHNCSILSSHFSVQFQFSDDSILDFHQTSWYETAPWAITQNGINRYLEYSKGVFFLKQMGLEKLVILEDRLLMIFHIASFIVEKKRTHYS